MRGHSGGYPSELVRLEGSFLECQGRWIADRVSITAEPYLVAVSVLDCFLSPV